VSFRRWLRTTRTKISLTMPLHYDNPAKYNLLSLYSHLYQWTSLLFLCLLVTPNKSSMPSPKEFKKTKFFSSTYWKSKLHATLQLHYGCFYFHNVRHFQRNYNHKKTKFPRSSLKTKITPTLPWPWHVLFLHSPVVLSTFRNGWQRLYFYKQVLTMAPHLRHFHLSQEWFTY